MSAAAATCLLFQDDFPLASLPLLGYTVSTPDESDGIQKEYVFKLHFKSHVYFFRAESEYTFERFVTSSDVSVFSYVACVRLKPPLLSCLHRWMEVIKSAASTAGRVSLLIPKGVEMNGN